MKLKIGRFVVWYLVFYFLIAGALRDLFLRGETDSFEVTSSIFDITSLCIFFLYSFLTYCTFHKFYPSKKWLFLAIGLLIALVLPMITRYLIEQKFTYVLLQQTNYRANYGMKNYIIDNYFYAMRYITFGTIYYFIVYTMHNQKREKDLLLSKKNMEMALLKSQVNPHFLLNSLNNIYSLVFHKSEHALVAMDKLTDILKYTLYDSKEFVPLQKEIQIAQEYIDLARLRFSYPINYNLSVENYQQPILVPQHLLLPIVENTIKHADLSDPLHPAITSIFVKKNKLHISSKNNCKLEQKDTTGGIGLDNLQKRLQLLYSTDGKFKIRKDDSSFSLTISIPLQ